MSSLQDKEGNSYIHIEYIMRKIMGWTDEDINLNKKYFQESPNSSTNGDGAGENKPVDEISLDDAPSLDGPPDADLGGGEDTTSEEITDDASEE
jgi:hypothetical protein